MADATSQNLKDFFAHVTDLDPVTNQQLTELSEWFTTHTGIENPTPNDFIRDIHKTYTQQVISHKRSIFNPTWG